MGIDRQNRLLRLPEESPEVADMLRNKRQEYEQRISMLVKEGPGQSREIGLYRERIAILTELLTNGEVDVVNFANELCEKRGPYSGPRTYLESCNIIADYIETGGANLKGGTGLESKKEFEARQAFIRANVDQAGNAIALDLRDGFPNAYALFADASTLPVQQSALKAALDEHSKPFVLQCANNRAIVPPKYFVITLNQFRLEAALKAKQIFDTARRKEALKGGVLEQLAEELSSNLATTLLQHVMQKLLTKGLGILQDTAEMELLMKDAGDHFFELMKVHPQSAALKSLGDQEGPLYLQAVIAKAMIKLSSLAQMMNK